MIIQRLFELFQLIDNIPPSISFFLDGLTKDLDFITFETVQQSGIIEFFCQILKSYTDEKILCITLSLIDNFLNLDFITLTMFEHFDLFTILSIFFNTVSNDIQLNIATIFHSAVLYDDLNSDDNEDEILNIIIQIYNKIRNIFIHQSCVWISNTSNEDLQFICLDFHLIIISFVYRQIINGQTLTEPFTNQQISLLDGLYIDLFKKSSERIMSISLKCLLYIMVYQKEIINFDPSEIAVLLLKCVQLDDKDIDLHIFHFLSAMTTLLLNLRISITFLHANINFSFLCQKMVTSRSNKTIYYLTLLFNSFINNGADSIDLLLKANFLEAAKNKFSQGNFYYCQVLLGSIKDTFLLSTPEQSMSVFKSGIIHSLFLFCEDTLDDTVPPLLYAIQVAAENCRQTLGTAAFNDIREILAEESNSLQKMCESNNGDISKYAEILIEALEID